MASLSGQLQGQCQNRCCPCIYFMSFASASRIGDQGEPFLRVPPRPRLWSTSFSKDSPGLKGSFTSKRPNFQCKSRKRPLGVRRFDVMSFYFLSCATQNWNRDEVRLKFFKLQPLSGNKLHKKYLQSVIPPRKIGPREHITTFELLLQIHISTTRYLHHAALPDRCRSSSSVRRTDTIGALPISSEVQPRSRKL